MAGTRGTWNSRFGFIMAAVGSAVGLGNLVRFPREMADQGGAAFLLVYLALLLLVGLPAILGEMTLGKITNLSPVMAFRRLAGERGGAWQMLGYFGMFAAIFVLFFYTVIAGWALRFAYEAFTPGATPWMSDPLGFFEEIAYGPWAIFWNGIVTLVMVFIVARGVSGGIEKATVIMMPALFAIVIGIAIFAGIKDAQNGYEGMKTVWQPDFGELKINHVAKATGQVFFSLSLGQGAMLTYASYMEKKQSVTKDGTTIALADTGVALLAAMMIFPILAFTGMLAEAEANPDGQVAEAVGGNFGTAFIALPNAFVEMGDTVGYIVGTIFFFGLFFAALSSAISLLEVPVSVMIDDKGVARWKAALMLGGITYSFGVLSAISETWLVLFDEIAINLFIVVGVALTTIFAGWVVKGVAKELDAGLKSRVGIYIVWMMRTVTPALIILTFVFGGLYGVNADGDIAWWHSEHADGGGTSANWRELGHTFKEAIKELR